MGAFVSFLLPGRRESLSFTLMEGRSNGRSVGGDGLPRATEEQRVLDTETADRNKGHSAGVSPDLDGVTQNAADAAPSEETLEARNNPPPPPVVGTLDFRRKSTLATLFCEALNFALSPDATRPAQAASFGRQTKNGALLWVERRFRLAFGGPEWCALPFSALVSRHFGRSSLRIPRRRHSLYISSEASGLPFWIRRILRSGENIGSPFEIRRHRSPP